MIVYDKMFSRNGSQSLDTLFNWLLIPGATVKLLDARVPTLLATAVYSAPTDCRAIHDCVFYGRSSTERLPSGGILTDEPSRAVTFLKCFNKQAVPDSVTVFVCPLLYDMKTSRPTTPARDDKICSNQYWSLNAEKWDTFNVDDSLQAFIKGGNDSDGNWWLGVDGALSEELGLSLLNVIAFICSLENPCLVPISCADVGWRIFRQDPIPSLWGFFALSALEHLSQQLSNQYQAIKGAAIRATLETFNIGDFFPKNNTQFSLLNTLTGLATTLAVASGYPSPLSAGFGADTVFRTGWRK